MDADDGQLLPHLIFKFLVSIQGEGSLAPILEQAYAKFHPIITMYIDGFGSAIFENTVVGAKFTTCTPQRRTHHHNVGVPLSLCRV